MNRESVQQRVAELAPVHVPGHSGRRSRRFRRASIAAALLALRVPAAEPLSGSGGPDLPRTADARCGAWQPGSGTVAARFLGGTARHTVRELSLTVSFRFSASEIDALRCTGARSLEVDLLVDRTAVRGGSRGWGSNLPGAYLDTEAFDSGAVRTLTVGTQRAARLRAGTRYRTSIRLTGFVTGTARARVFLNFQRGHWASARSPREILACLSHGGADPAWCIFPTPPTFLMASVGYVGPEIDFSRGSAAAAWATNPG